MLRPQFQHLLRVCRLTGADFHARGLDEKI